MATCYRHPSRETAVSCSSCDRPICTECMTPTSVGMRCPECSKQRTKVHHGPQSIDSDPVVTYALIGICVLVFIGSGFGSTSSEIYLHGALFGPLVNEGEYWRLVTSGFLHDGFLHIAFNMYLLYVLGQMYERTCGSARFAAIYFASLLTGSLGAIILSNDAVTVGASGAIFGLMGALFIEARARGENPFRSQIGLLIAFNLVLTVLLGFSIGGHVGGLVGGALVGALIYEADKRRLPRWSAFIVCAVVGAIALGASIALAQPFA